MQRLQNLIGICIADKHQHANTAIEGAQHLHHLDLALVAQPSENRWQLPAAAIKMQGQIVGKDARRILDKPASGHMADPADSAGGMGRPCAMMINPRRGNQRIAKWRHALGKWRVKLRTGHFNHPPHQRISV